MKLVTLSIGIILCLLSTTEILADTPAPGRARTSEAQYSTKMDFDSSMIDGKMKAPSGFFLQGRNRQELQSMVRLRSNFRERLDDSRSAVKAMVR